jgi:hypothetical protein
MSSLLYTKPLFTAKHITQKLVDGSPQSAIMTSTTTRKPSVPYRQIRAVFDDGTITVYQAYSASIAVAAVEKQKLNASPDFKLGRMTWIKPSWCWMMYFSLSLNKLSSLL